MNHGFRFNPVHALVLMLVSQAPAAEPAHFPHPNGYVAYKSPKPIVVDGDLNDAAWLSASWTSDFVDIEGDRKPRPRFRTRAKMAWDERYLYIAAELEEPEISASLTAHDSVIFHDNDFEVFLDPDGDNHSYFEIEINTLNTEWDLFLPKPYRDQGKADNSWEIPGLLKSVRIDGTLNNPSDTDKGWTVELAIPWESVRERGGRLTPPKDGDQWRINFSRVEWHYTINQGKYVKVPKTYEDNWVWSPQYAINMHRPERWGYLQFSTGSPGSAVFQPDPSASARDALHQVYYAQWDFFKQHGRYAASLAELALPPGVPKELTLAIRKSGYTAELRGLRIGEDSRITLTQTPPH
jgi:hypothetical protein